MFVCLFVCVCDGNDPLVLRDPKRNVQMGKTGVLPMRRISSHTKFLPLFEKCRRAGYPTYYTPSLTPRSSRHPTLYFLFPIPLEDSALSLLCVKLLF